MWTTTVASISPVSLIPFFNFFFWVIKKTKDVFVSTNHCVESGSVSRNFSHGKLPGVKLTLEELFEWDNIADTPLKRRSCYSSFPTVDQYELLTKHILERHIGPQLLHHEFTYDWRNAAVSLECTKCSKKFSRRPHLQRHMESVHCEESFACEKCQKIYKGLKSKIKPPLIAVYTTVVLPSNSNW